MKKRTTRSERIKPPAAAGLTLRLPRDRSMDRNDLKYTLV
jgi:hypothetical protein